MASELKILYRKYRDAGCRHFEAIEKLAMRLDLDKATVARTLDKADAADRADAHRARKRRMRGGAAVRT